MKEALSKRVPTVLLLVLEIRIVVSFWLWKRMQGIWDAEDVQFHDINVGYTGLSVCENPLNYPFMMLFLNNILLSQTNKELELLGHNEYLCMPRREMTPWKNYQQIWR